ncbi:hypothetical protein AB0P36_34370 [Streptomyces flavidovirens]|uniref:hypothetical protein n=1 Tax=Streptomyces flavidovirens TaxID=67298 RepID=UPI003415C85D
MHARRLWTGKIEISRGGSEKSQAGLTDDPLSQWGEWWVGEENGCGFNWHDPDHANASTQPESV